MSKKLTNKKIAFLATDGFEQVELTKPWEALEKEGATLHLVSLENGEIQGVHHMDKGDSFTVDRTVDAVSASDYDGLVIPGGLYNPDALRQDKVAVQFVRDFFENGRPVSAICHGPWLLVEAGVVDGCKLTSWPSLKTDIENAGGTWVDEEMVCDSGMTTSRNPDDLPAFIDKTIEEMCEGHHDDQESKAA
jgi:protease I